MQTVCIFLYFPGLLYLSFFCPYIQLMIDFINFQIYPLHS